MAGASGRSMAWLVNVELRGIPAHVWKTSTAEQFLNPLACIQQVHPETLELMDMDTFRCSAWCMDPAAFPPTKELWVTEPPVDAMEAPAIKRLLSYPIEIKCSILLGPDTPPPPPLAEGGPPPAGGEGGDGSPTRRWRRCPSSPSPSNPSPMSQDGRRPVRERVGPSSSNVAMW